MGFCLCSFGLGRGCVTISVNLPPSHNQEFVLDTSPPEDASDQPGLEPHKQMRQDPGPSPPCDDHDKRRSCSSPGSFPRACASLAFNLQGFPNAHNHPNSLQGARANDDIIAISHNEHPGI